MSQYSSYKFDDTACLSSGPRPPVPGKESRRKMTENLNTDKARDSPPNYYRWSEKLSSLLEDEEGAALFKRFVQEQEGDEHLKQFSFYFACEGLKQQRDNEKMTQLIGAIYKRFLKRAPRGSKLHVSDQMRNMIKAGLKNDIVLAPDIFDQMQADVAAIIGNTIYPNFLQSDMYIQYIQNKQTSSDSGSEAPSCVGVSLGISGTSTGTISSMTNSCSELLLHSSSTLPTLHEDSVLEPEKVNDEEIEKLYGALGPGIAGSSISVSSSVSGAGSASMPSGKPAMTLTKDALMATQKRRLEMRPPGAHGYSVYMNYASYNPVSRRDSELASLSSGRTESDKMPPPAMYHDGQSHTQRRHQSRQHSALEQRQINENVVFNDNLKHIPRSQRVHPKVLSTEQFQTELMNKLLAVQQAQEKEGEVIRKVREIDQMDKSQSNRSFADAIRQKLQVEDDNDQDILDKHVSRVWSDLTPSRSPDIMSPCPNISRARRYELGSFGSGSMSAQSSMRHSKSMPEGHPLNMAGPAAPPLPRNKPLNNKWPSVYTDSGISLLSTDTLSKYSSKDMPPSMSTNSSRPLSRTMHADMSIGNTTHLLQESSRRLDDEAKRSKRHQHPLPPLPLPPAATSSSLVPPPIPAKPQSSTATEFIVVVYLFCDEEVPYRMKIPGSHPPTLKQFKDYLPKKGNYRFFFKTHCDDLDSPVIQEEISNDNEVLPLFEGKVMGTVKPLD